uniref:Zinc finger HIT-type containing 1 n=1 Tax=Salvator merianae TaxID=96440 RepID=A0A8D0BDB7_SALMN
MVEKKVSARSQDPSQRRILDRATRQRRLNRQLEALENDNFQDDPHANMPQLVKRLPQFDDDAETGGICREGVRALNWRPRPSVLVVTVVICNLLLRQCPVVPSREDSQPPKTQLTTGYKQHLVFTTCRYKVYTKQFDFSSTPLALVE